MEAARWKRVSELFAEAKRLPEPERAEFLAEQCEGDEHLRADIESRLAVSSRETLAVTELDSLHFGETLLNDEGPAHQPTVPATPGAEVSGPAIDRHRILENLGEGGMGTVFLADQRAPVPVPPPTAPS